jgi:SAM-dependent methyltransferase
MPTDKKTVNLYNKLAANWTKSKRDNSNLCHVYLEKPAIYSKLPNLKERTVLCLGCGSGEETDYLRLHGAKKVVGIDISKKLIEIAKSSYPDIEFHVKDIEKLDFPEESFDFAFSSLTMHYLENWTKALKGINKILKKNSLFLFSITSPFFSSMKKVDNIELKSRLVGYKDYTNTKKYQIFGDYLSLYTRKVCVAPGLTVINYHRPLSLILKEIRSSGFELLDLVEPKAIPESKKQDPKFWAIHQKITEFMIFELRKK